MTDFNSMSEKVQLAAVNECGYAIKFIKNPSETIQLAAVNQNGFAIRFMTNIIFLKELVLQGISILQKNFLTLYMF